MVIKHSQNIFSIKIFCLSIIFVCFCIAGLAMVAASILSALALVGGVGYMFLLEKKRY